MGADGWQKLYSHPSRECLENMCLLENQSDGEFVGYLDMADTLVVSVDAAGLIIGVVEKVIKSVVNIANVRMIQGQLF
jgi:hypothetical protein